MADKSNQDIYENFYDAVNMQPKELEEWLDTEESKSVGQKTDGKGESVGHKSGRKIVRIKRKKKADLTQDDYDHMNKVVGYINRHTAQRPDGDVTDTDWAYSLKNWGYDPTK
ncbi:DUF3140 domain-containing protein [Lewinella sp. 4G2]|uniref:DUF3140 domain-containing protein n=1 Tax=Lewinella sp. 4G2 TaxID=1803372 RepID=UPI0007B4E7E2|nr:DUF3140 domain-containing protein [Lewinella sp. 4G2]OAV44507.1 DNA-binding protein [Lewinella sp. 4G2]